MIVTVRIAPFKRWCPPMKQAALRCSNLVAEGTEITIETASMRTKQKVHPCNGREWLVKGIPSYVRIVDEDGYFPTTHGQAWICEHLLELD